jgi:hypothetical protein
VATRLSPLKIKNVNIGQSLDSPPQELEGEELGIRSILAHKDFKIFELEKLTVA